MTLRIDSPISSAALYGQEQDDSFLGLAGGFASDVLLSPFRIVEGVYDDTLGAIIGDTNRASLFGEQQTIAGGLIQDVGEFLTAFIPASSVLKAGALGTKALGLTKAAQAARSPFGKAATEVARGAVAGAVADFAVFDGHEERLSNLINSHTSLGNAVTEYLAADETDSEIEGRFKNALEGLALGGLTEPFFAAVKGLRARGRGASIADALTETDQAALESRTIARAIDESRSVDLTGARSELREAEAEAGVDSFADTTQEAANVVRRIMDGLGIDPTGPLGPEAQILERFADRIGPLIHENIRVKFTSKTSEKSSFDFANRVITISHSAAREGRLAREVIHEVYHALQDYLPQRLRNDLSDSYKAARDLAIEKDPDLANRLTEAANGNRAVLGLEDYKYLNEDEWFAEIATAKTLSDIQDELASVTKPQVTDVFRQGRLMMQHVFDVFRGMWGEAPVQRALTLLRDEKRSLQIQPSNENAVTRYMGDFNDENAEFINELQSAFKDTKEFADTPEAFELILGKQKARLSKANPNLSPEEISNLAKTETEDFLNRARAGKLNIQEQLDLYGRDFQNKVFNNSRALDNTADAAHMEVALSKVYDREMRKFGDLDTKALSEMNTEIIGEIAQMMGMTAADRVAMLGRLAGKAKGEKEVLRKLSPMLRAKRDVLKKVSKDFSERLNKIDVRDASPDDLADFLLETKKTVEFQAYTKGFISEWARGLGSLRIDDLDAKGLTTRPAGSIDSAVPPAKLKPKPQVDSTTKRTSTPDGTGSDFGFDDFQSQRRREAIIEQLGGEKNARRHLAKMQEVLRMGKDLDQLLKTGDDNDLLEVFSRVNKILEEQSRTGVGAMLSDYWYFSLLSNTSTLAVNLLSTGAMTIYQPIEQMIGAGVRRATGAVSGDDLLKFEAAEEFQRAMDQFSGIFKYMGDGFTMLKRSFKERRSFLTETELNPEQTVQRNAFDEDNLRKVFERGDVGKELGKAPEALVQSGRWLGRLVGYPGDILRASDEMWKQINYRAYVHSHLMKEARIRARDAGTTVAEEAKKIPDEMENYISNGSAITKRRLLEVHKARILKKNPELRNDPERLQAETVRKVNTLIEENPQISAIAQKALEVAESNTFTTPLAPGGTASTIQNLINRHPLTKIFVPFFRTPLNIFNQGFERVAFTPKNIRRLSAQTADFFDRNPWNPPLLSLEPEYRALQRDTTEFTTNLRSASPEEQAEIMGKMSVAVTTLAGLSYAVSAGMITGGGPGDVNMRRNLEATGWQPYSIRVGDTWISYARMDPFATFMGVAADFVEYLAESDESERVEGAFGAGIFQYPAAPLAALVTSFTKQATEKTFLQGISNIVEVLNNPDQRSAGVLSSLAAAAVPNIGKGVRDITAPFFESDPTLRHAKGAIDKMKDKIPGLSQTLPPRRNFLGESLERYPNFVAGWGTTLTGIRFSTVKDDVISKEIANIGLSLQPPKPQLHGTDLHTIEVKGTTAYDRLLQLRSEVRLDGRTLRQELVRLIRTAEYQRFSAVSTYDLDSPRLQAFRNTVNRYHRQAMRQLLSESPELSLAERQFAKKRRLASLGISLQ